MRRLIVPFLALCALFSSAAFAGGGTWTNVTVTAYTVFTSEGYAPKGIVIVTFSAAGTGGPDCARAATTQATINIDTVGGAFAAQILSTARLTGETVTVTGTGSCKTMSTIENIAKVTEHGEDAAGATRGSPSAPPAPQQ